MKDAGRAEKLYEEKIYPWGLASTLALITGGFLVALLYQIFVGPLGDHPAPNSFFLLMVLLFLAITVTFSSLHVVITPRSVMVSFGIFMKRIRWENIENCYLDEASSIRYGGWGIRIGRVKGKWRLVYSLIGMPRVVLALKHGIFQEFVFSTGNPDDVMEVIQQKSGRIT